MVKCTCVRGPFTAKFPTIHSGKCPIWKRWFVQYCKVMDRLRAAEGKTEGQK